MSAKHAQTNRHSPLATLSVLALTCAVAFSLYANAQALAESPATATAPLLADVTPDVPATSRERPRNIVQELNRIAREMASQLQRERRADHRKVQRLRELRQERRDRARERAARADRHALERWVMPVSGGGWSAAFGESGSMWSSGYHTGQDFTAPTGTPVVAASGGTITFAGWSDAYGNKVEITHANGKQTWYAHLDGFKRTTGAVAPGAVIGYVGCTGNCYGSHLHFEYHPGGGEAADPIAWLRSQGAL